MISLIDAVIGFASATMLALGLLLWRRRRALVRKVPSVTNAITAPLPSDSNVLEDADIEVTEISYGTSVDQPALSISRLPKFKARDAKVLDIKKTKLDRLSPILQTAPSIITAAQMQSGNYMKVVINGPLAKCADGDGMRAFTHGTGGIKEHARLYDGKNLKSFINATAIWQIASVIVAQKHMADIKESLDEIKKDVADIKKFLEAQRYSKLAGAMDYLEQAKTSVLSGELSPALRNQLEDVERDATEVQRHLESEIRDWAKDINNIAHSEWFGTEDFVKEIDSHQDIYEEKLRQWYLCIRVRAMNLLVLSAFPNDDALKAARLEAIRASAADLMSTGSVGADAANRMKWKINEVRSAFNSEETLQQRRGTLTDRFNRIQGTLDKDVQRTGKRMRDGHTKLLAYQQPMAFAVKMNGTQIEAAYELVGNNAPISIPSIGTR